MGPSMGRSIRSNASPSPRSYRLLSSPVARAVRGGFQFYFILFSLLLLLLLFLHSAVRLNTHLVPSCCSCNPLCLLWGAGAKKKKGNWKRCENRDTLLCRILSSRSLSVCVYTHWPYIVIPPLERHNSYIIIIIIIMAATEDTACTCNTAPPTYPIAIA